MCYVWHRTDGIMSFEQTDDQITTRQPNKGSTNSPFREFNVGIERTNPVSIILAKPKQPNVQPATTYLECELLANLQSWL